MSCLYRISLNQAQKVFKIPFYHKSALPLQLKIAIILLNLIKLMSFFEGNSRKCSTVLNNHVPMNKETVV